MRHPRKQGRAGQDSSPTPKMTTDEGKENELKKDDATRGSLKVSEETRGEGEKKKEEGGRDSKRGGRDEIRRNVKCRSRREREASPLAVGTSRQGSRRKKRGKAKTEARDHVLQVYIQPKKRLLTREILEARAIHFDCAGKTRLDVRRYLSQVQQRKRPQMKTPHLRGTSGKERQKRKKEEKDRKRKRQIFRLWRQDRPNQPSVYRKTTRVEQSAFSPHEKTERNAAAPACAFPSDVGVEKKKKWTKKKRKRLSDASSFL